jgi:hypothetical protein
MGVIRRRRWRCRGAFVERAREGFLLVHPRRFSWDTSGRHFVDDVLVSEPIYQLAYTGQVTAARALWLAGFDVPRST